MVGALNLAEAPCGMPPWCTIWTLTAVPRWCRASENAWIRSTK